MKKRYICFALAAVINLGWLPAAIAQEAATPAPAAAQNAPAAPVTAVQQAPLAVDINAPAPAAPAAAAPSNDWMTYKNPYAGEQNDLANPNRTKEEVTAWAEKVVMDALTFSQEDVNEKITAAKSSFVQQGWQEYAAYIKESKLLDKIRSQNVMVKTIANGGSVVLGSEAIGGVYNWIVETPLLITFTKKDLVTGEEETISTGVFKSTVMVSRVDKKIKEEGVAIKGWRIDPNGRR